MPRFLFTGYEHVCTEPLHFGKIKPHSITRGGLLTLNLADRDASRYLLYSEALLPLSSHRAGRE